MYLVAGEKTAAAAAAAARDAHATANPTRVPIKLLRRSVSRSWTGEL
jgi:hypothetical protein